MKRIFASFVLLCMTISCFGVASAVNMQEFRASLTLSRYSAVISAGDRSGRVIIGYDVKASKPADSVGIESIDFYTKDGEIVKSVTGSTRNGLIRNNSMFCAGDYECSIPSGNSYYAKVTIFAKVGSNYDSRTITTSTIRVH